MTRDEFDKVLGVLEVAYPKLAPEVGEDEDPYNVYYELWYRHAGHFDYKQATVAIDRMIATRRSPFAPTINEVLTEVAKFSDVQVALTPEEGWDIVYNRTLPEKDWPPVVKQAYETVGGWSSFYGIKTDSLGTLRAHFFRSFEALRGRLTEELVAPQAVIALPGQRDLKMATHLALRAEEQAKLEAPKPKVEPKPEPEMTLEEAKEAEARLTKLGVKGGPFLKSLRAKIKNLTPKEKR